MSTQLEFSKKNTITGHAGAIYSIQFDGQFIYSGSADKYVVRWSAATGEQDKFAIKMPATPYSIQLLADNTKLAIGLSSGHLHFVDLVDRKELKLYVLHQKGIYAMAENTAKKQLIVGDGDGLISIWNTETLELVIKMPFDCGKIRSIVVSEDGNLLFIGSQDGNLRVIETTHFNVLHDIFAHQDGVGSILLFDENLLITGGKDAHLKLWDRKSMTTFKSIPAHNFMIYDLLKLDEAHFISASRDKSIKIWDAANLNVLQKLELKSGGHRHSVNKLVRLKENSFASCSDDARILVWGN